jgi:hypothetical protein
VKAIDPFANERDSLQINGLTIENRSDRVSIYGDIEITRDKTGLKRARQIAELLTRIIKTLSAEKLPDNVPPPKASETVNNPFE